MLQGRPGLHFALIKVMKASGVFKSIPYCLGALIGLLGFNLSGQASELDLHPGYLASVKEERTQLSTEIVILPQEESEEIPLQDQIFTDKLTRDFRDRYERNFGRTQAQQFQSIPSRFFEKDLGNGQFVSEEEYVRRQQRFGNYMTRRLIEYHTDRYMKETPSGQKIYKVKESISNVTVKTKTGFRYKFRYNIASNDIDLKIENPYGVDTKVTFESSNTILTMGYPISKTVRILSDYSADNSEFNLSGIKALKNGWSTSLTGTASEIEEKVILGFNWAD